MWVMAKALVDGGMNRRPFLAPFVSTRPKEQGPRSGAAANTDETGKRASINQGKTLKCVPTNDPQRAQNTSQIGLKPFPEKRKQLSKQERLHGLFIVSLARPRRQVQGATCPVAQPALATPHMPLVESPLSGKAAKSRTRRCPLGAMPHQDRRVEEFA